MTEIFLIVIVILLLVVILYNRHYWRHSSAYQIERLVLALEALKVAFGETLLESLTPALEALLQLMSEWEDQINEES